MVTLSDYKASSIKVRNICGMKTTTIKNVLKEFLFLVIPTMLHGFKEEFGWDYF